MADDGPIVVLERVTKRFGSVVAVDDVSLEVRRGEFVSLVGPSGCGKTTTLRMIGGFEEPTAGRVFIEGRDVSGVPPNRRSTNMCFQRYALFPHLNVFDNVAYGLRVRKRQRWEIVERVSRALELVDLAGFELRRVHELSGGQSQRVALARALVNEPSVLLLDEPLGALDLKLRRQMQIELRRIQHALGTTFIYVTHDQEEALAMSSRIFIMNQGRVVQEGAPAEVYSQPANEFAASFVGESNLLRVTATGPREGSWGDVKVEMNVGSAPPGSEMLVSLRPERIALQPAEEPSGAPNRARGRIREAIFLGPLVRYLVEVADRYTLRVVHLSSGGRTFREGDEVLAEWQADDMVEVSGA
ncbi:MAG: ABC transporter ATP-binding protein [Armatimonadota bacterium]|nr:MAG: ABC transporter ATP-binding protein [Armatimonadota bacterium]